MKYIRKLWLSIITSMSIISLLILTFFLLLLVLGLPIDSIIHSLFMRDTPKSNDPFLYASTWNVYIDEDARNIIFLESDYRALGDGVRYALFSGTSVYHVNRIPTSQKNGSRRSEIHESVGYGIDSLVQSLTDTISQALNIPSEYTPSLEDCHWCLFSRPAWNQSDALLVLIDYKKQYTYIFETLQ